MEEISTLRLGEPEVITIKKIAKLKKRRVEVYSESYKAWVWCFNPQFLTNEQYRIKDLNGNYIYTRKGH